MSNKFFSIKIFFSFFLILIPIFICKKQSIILPFKSNQQPDNKILTKEQFFESNEHFKMYTLFEIGNPPNKIPLFYTFYNSSLSLHSNLDIKDSIKSTYNPQNSTTFKSLENDQVQDELTIQTEDGKLIKNFTFLYKNQNNDIKNIFGNIGLQNFYKENINQKISNPNFLYQLKNLGLIDYMSYNVNYTSQNEGFININIEPNEYDPNYYPIEYKCTTEIKGVKSSSINDFGEYLWSIDINSIYYENNEKKRVSINEVKEDKYSALLNPEYGLIKGPNSYKTLIERDFFNKLIKDNICSTTDINKKIFYSCNVINKKELKEKFPTLYLYQQEFNYTFELVFEDLFYEYNNNLYFLICFDNGVGEDDKFLQISEWVLGKPFLDKYQFSFDIEQNKIYFYENFIRYIVSKNKILKDRNNLYVNRLLPKNNLILIGFSMFVIFVTFFCISFYIKKNCNSPNNANVEEQNGKSKKYAELEESPDSFNKKDSTIQN